MARHVTPKHKVVSSGRLMGCGRGQMTKTKVAGRPLKSPPELSYSLYSADSEDQVTTINKGLDRCAALLGDILQAEKTDPKTKSHISSAATSKNKPSLGKNEMERKRTGRKSNTVARVNKRPAPVRKTILPTQAITGLRRQPGVPVVQHLPADVIRSEAKPGGSLVTQVACVQPHSLPLGRSLPTTGLQPCTVFNSRLTTSTPTLSPRRPTSAHSEASLRGTDGETRHVTQQFSTSSTQHRALCGTVSPSQYTGSFTVAPAVQLQPTASTVGQLNPFSAAENAARARSGGQGSSLQSQSGPDVCASPPAPLTDRIVVCDGSQDQPLSSAECVVSASEESGGCMSEEDELDRVDTMSVKDASCQTSIDQHTGILKYKMESGSPEKTARKVMTLKYLLGELKALVANQDSEAVHLISEVEQSISLLPTMVGSTNVQAELALALQPLRSENVQLRRRLRILNQQLQERERAERHGRSVDCNLELASLQSLNLTLQAQINERQNELENLQQENRNLRQALDDRENDLQQTKEQFELESSRIRADVSEALAEMRNCKAKLEDRELEKIALTHSLQQKETEITKLQELIRNLQKSPILCHPTQTDAPSSSAPSATLTKRVLDQYENQRTVASRVTDCVKTYLQTLEDSGHSSPAPPQLHKHPRSSPDQFCRQENAPKSLDVNTSMKSATVGRVSQEVDKTKTAFVNPLQEAGRVRPAAVPQKHSPGKGRVGLKYLGLAFNKLAISNGLSDLENDPGPDGMSLQLKQPSEAAVNPAEQSQHARRRLYMGDASVNTGRPSAYANSFSSYDIKSLASDWSMNTWSTFNTRDEQEFRNGLAALDASIASLQRTLKADLKR